MAKTDTVRKVTSMTAKVAAIGPYAPGKIIRTNDGHFGYSSGQIALNYKTGKLVSPNKASGQARQALKNLKTLAKLNGFELNRHTVKTTVFLTDMADFKECNEVYAKFFDEECLPARSCVSVQGLPMGAKFEIEAVFFKE